MIGRRIEVYRRYFLHWALGIEVVPSCCQALLSITMSAVSGPVEANPLSMFSVATLLHAQRGNTSSSRCDMS